MSSAICFNLDQSKILSFVNGLIPRVIHRLAETGLVKLCTLEIELNL